MQNNEAMALINYKKVYYMVQQTLDNRMFENVQNIL